VPRIGVAGRYCPESGFGGLGECYMTRALQFEIECGILRSNNECKRWRITPCTRWRGKENPIGQLKYLAPSTPGILNSSQVHRAGTLTR